MKATILSNFCFIIVYLLACQREVEFPFDIFEEMGDDGVSNSIGDGDNWRIGKSLPEQMVHFLKAEIDTDVEFTIAEDNAVLKAHKYMLVVRSAYFAEVFAKNKGTATIVVDDGTSAHFQLFLEHLYTGNEVKKVKDAFPLLKLAVKYKVPDIEAQCTELLKKEITDETALGIFEKSGDYGDGSLQDEALIYICKRAYTLIDATPDFLELGRENLKKLMRRDDLQVYQELKLFKVVVDWGKAEMGRQGMPNTEKYLRSVLEDVVRLIRFPLMARNEFYEHVLFGDMRILSSEESDELRDYFNANHMQRGELKLRIFDRTHRNTPKNNGKVFLVERLSPASSNIGRNGQERMCVNLLTNTPTGDSCVPFVTAPHSIRFKTSAHLWITSLGDVPCYLENEIHAKYEIKDLDSETVIASLTVNSGDLDGTEWSFESPVPIIPGIWYSASITLLNTEYAGQLYSGGRANIAVPTDDGDVVFEFADDNLVLNPYTGVKQGFIPTIGFQC